MGLLYVRRALRQWADSGLGFAGGGGCAPVDQIDGVVPLGASFDHPADTVIGFDVTTLPASSVIQLEFRRVDENNNWFAEVSTVGVVKLRERVTGTATTRGTAGTSVEAGQRIVVVADGTSITFYINGVSQFTYSSATNFATAVIGFMRGLGGAGNGVISDIKAWTLACASEEGI